MQSHEVDLILTSAFGRVPPFVKELVAGLDLAALENFAASLVIPFAERPVRIAASDSVDPVAWERSVKRRFPDPVVSEFISLVDGRRRRMIDTAGGASAELYLDDLDVEPCGKLDSTDQVMAATLFLPSRRRSVLVRKRTPPLSLVPPGARSALERLLELGAAGVWALRIVDDRVVGFLWVSESRWRGDTESTLAIAEALEPSSCWRRVTRVVSQVGCAAYPDAIEWTPDGLDVTLGVVRTAS